MSDININPLFIRICKKNSKKEVWDNINDLKPEYLDDDWEDEFEDMEEAYDETGRCSAEHDILNDLIKNNCMRLPTKEHCKLFDMLTNHYELTII